MQLILKMNPQLLKIIIKLMNLITDSMGANFINSCLEKISQTFENEFKTYTGFSKDDKLEIIMSILSNHTPECLVKAEVSCKIKDLESKEITDSKLFAISLSLRLKSQKIIFQEL